MQEKNVRTKEIGLWRVTEFSGGSLRASGFRRTQYAILTAELQAVSVERFVWLT